MTGPGLSSLTAIIASRISGDSSTNSSSEMTTSKRRFKARRACPCTKPCPYTSQLPFRLSIGTSQRVFSE